MYATAYAAATATNLPESLILMHAAALRVAGDRRRGTALYAAVLDRIAAEREEQAPVCRWCEGAAGDDATTIAGDPICRRCVPDYERTVFGIGGEAPARPGLAALDESDVLVWETAAGLDAVQLAAYSEGYADGTDAEGWTFQRAA
jgi:hypothetical protein